MRKIRNGFVKIGVKLTSCDKRLDVSKVDYFYNLSNRKVKNSDKTSLNNSLLATNVEIIKL